MFQSTNPISINGTQVAATAHFGQGQVLKVMRICGNDLSTTLFITEQSNMGRTDTIRTEE
jgi:hypothetical protein